MMCLKAAHEKPEMARNNANNYMLFAEEAGYSHQKYKDTSGIWGAYYHHWNLKDRFSTCNKMIADAGGCCKKSKQRRFLGKNCAATCVTFEKQKKCGGKGNLAPFDKAMIEEGHKLAAARRARWAAKAKARE